MKRDFVVPIFGLIMLVLASTAGVLRAAQIGQPEIAAVGCFLGVLVAAACVGLVVVMAKNR